MKDKYEELMDRIEVDDGMRDRILTNINRELNTPAAKPTDRADTQGAGKITRFPRWSRYASIAAALAVFAVGAWMYTGSHQGNLVMDSSSTFNMDISDDTSVSSVYAPETYTTTEQLENAVGFTVAVPDSAIISLEDAAVTCTALLDGDSNLAEVTFRGSEQTLTFRQAPGTDDISGDYTEYSVTETVDVDGTSVTLKGTGDGYLLAIWSDDTFSYALNLTDPLPEESITELILSSLSNR